jgi:hypothetical protein
MKKFNINDYIYIQITEQGWKHLKATVGDEYIKHCITSPHYKVEIDGEIWYRLQCHVVFDLLPPSNHSNLIFNNNVLFDDNSLETL